MHTRFKKIRKELGLTQEKIGERLGVSRDVIANVELNRVNISELFINHFCEEFDVNKDWLLTGKGNKYNIDEKYTEALTEEDIIIADIFASITIGENDELKELIKKISKLDKEYLKAITKLIDGIIKE